MWPTFIISLYCEYTHSSPDNLFVQLLGIFCIFSAVARNGSGHDHLVSSLLKIFDAPSALSAAITRQISHSPQTHLSRSFNWPGKYKNSLNKMDPRQLEEQEGSSDSGISEQGRAGLCPRHSLEFPSDCVRWRVKKTWRQTRTGRPWERFLAYGWRLCWEFQRIQCQQHSWHLSCSSSDECRPHVWRPNACYQGDKSSDKVFN